MMNGWIKISRELPKHWIWQDAERLKWWLDLLLMASWDDGQVLSGGSRLIEIKMMSALGHDTEAENRALAARNDALQLADAQTLNLDAAAIRKSLRLTNAVRLLKHEVLPKLNKINNERK